MKLSHISILFSIVFISLLIFTFINNEKFKTAAEAKYIMDSRLEAAVEESANKLFQINDNKDYIMDRELAFDTYINSLAASLGVMSDPIKKADISKYTPVLVVLFNDGYYISYFDEYIDVEGNKNIIRKWTELKQYVYEDNNFIYSIFLDGNISIYDKNNILDNTGENKVFYSNINDIRTADSFLEFRNVFPDNFLLNDDSFYYIRQQTIINSLENDMSWYISNYNNFAKNYGINYRFSLSFTSDSDWTETITGPGILAVFQGFPLVDNYEIYYNNIIFNGGGIQFDKIYYLEKKDWYYLYHNETCNNLVDNNNVYKDRYLSKDDCINAGAYACPDCQKIGVYPPDYRP